MFHKIPFRSIFFTIPEDAAIDDIPDQDTLIDHIGRRFGILTDDLAELIHTKIYLVDTFDEIERYNGYLDGIERMLDMVHHRVVA